MDEPTRTEVAAWMAKARRDLASARRLLEGSPPFLDTAVYHAQQAAEKALKAYLTACDEPFPKAHDLVLLLELCRRHGPSLAFLQEAAITLTPYATLYRYPDVVMEPDAADAQSALSHAAQVLASIGDHLRPLGVILP